MSLILDCCPFYEEATEVDTLGADSHSFLPDRGLGRSVGSRRAFASLSRGSRYLIKQFAESTPDAYCEAS